MTTTKDDMSTLPDLAPQATWPVHLPPLSDDELGEQGYRTHTTVGLPLCELHPAASTGYWYVTRFEWPAGVAEGWSRPLKASGLPMILDFLRIPTGASWTPFSTEPRSKSPWLAPIPQSAPDEDRSVYLIQSVDGGLVKIGSADSVTARLEQIQRMSPVPLRVIAVISGGYATEMALHRRFADDRSHGEWFRPSAELFAMFGVTR